MYAVQNLTCLAIVVLALIPAFAILAVRFSQFTKTQLLVLVGGFIVAGLFIALLVNNFAGVLPCMFPALFFGVLYLIKHYRDMQRARATLEAATVRQAAPRIVAPPKSSPDSSSFDFD